MLCFRVKKRNSLPSSASVMPVAATATAMLERDSSFPSAGAEWNRRGQYRIDGRARFGGDDLLSFKKGVRTRCRCQ